MTGYILREYLGKQFIRKGKIRRELQTGNSFKEFCSQKRKWDLESRGNRFIKMLKTTVYLFDLEMTEKRKKNLFERGKLGGAVEQWHPKPD